MRPDTASGVKLPGLSPAIAATLALLLVGLSATLQAVRDRSFPLPASDDQTVYVTRRMASRLVFTFRPLAADVSWIRAIQYYGGHKRRIDAESIAAPPPMLADEPPPELSYAQLYPMLDVTTTLDPRFNIAYRFGAIFLSEAYPSGAGRPDLAIALLEKAVEAMPEKWEYLHDMGFVEYWDVHDFQKAAAYFNRAADLPGAPWWLRSMAATMLVKGGQRSASRMLWRQLYDSATDEHARTAALTKLQQLDALDQIEALQRVVRGFEARTGTVPRSWATLVGAGLLRGIPVDPGGTPYDLSPTGVVSLSSGSRLFPLPVEPSPTEGGPDA